MTDTVVYDWEHPDEDACPACPVCGSTETVELHDDLQSITVCGNCGSDEP